MGKCLGCVFSLIVLGTTAIAEMPREFQLISYLGKNRAFDIFMSENRGHVSVKCKYTWWRGEELWVEKDAIISGLDTQLGHFRVYGAIENCESQLDSLRQWFLVQEYPFQKSIQINKNTAGELEIKWVENSREDAEIIFQRQQAMIIDSLETN